MVFVKDGCLLAEQGETDFDVDGTLQKRIESKVQRDLI